MGSMNRRYCPQRAVEVQALHQAQWEDAEKTISLQFHPDSLYTPSIIYRLAMTHSNQVTKKLWSVKGETIIGLKFNTVRERELAMNLFHAEIAVAKEELPVEDDVRRRHLDNIIATLGSAYTHSHNSGLPIIPRLSYSDTSVVREWDTGVTRWPSPPPEFEMDYEDVALLSHDPYAKHNVVQAYEPIKK